VLARRLRELQPDVVQVHLLSGQLWGLPAARLARVPLVLSTEHSLMEESIENRPLTEPLRRLYLALNRLASRTVAVSGATADRLVRWGVPARGITVIDNGIDFARLTSSASSRAAARDELGIGPDVEVVGAVGRLEPVKRFRQLLAAVAPTLEAGRRELVIVGNGPLRASLTQQAEALGVADLVHVTGPRADVPALLSAMDVLVSASRDETFGMAVLEGIGAGLPVVHAQCPALDALAEPVPGAFAIGTTDDDAEAAAIVAALEAALAFAPGQRLPVPAAVLDAYDITRTTARLDRLVDEGVRPRRAR
jgi:glycosyltransferase involved in cell wall biosynthesis